MTRNCITVIVCAYNQSEKLDHCLRSLFEARLPYGWHREIIVVDNNSSDDTPEVVTRHITDHPDMVRYLKEPVQGKSFALNRGILESRGEIVAFIDQDCLVSLDWFEVIAHEFECDPGVDVVGGRVELENAEDAQTTVRTSTERRTLTLSDVMPAYIPIVGCNVAVRREAFNRIGLFDTAFGPGTNLPAAEDLDMLHRMVAGKLKVVYVPESVIFHDHGRSDEATLARLAQAYAVSRGGYYGKFALRFDSHGLRAAYDEMWPLFKDILRHPFGERTRRKRVHLTALCSGTMRFWKRALFRRRPHETTVEMKTNPRKAASETANS